MADPEGGQPDPAQQALENLVSNHPGLGVVNDEPIADDGTTAKFLNDNGGQPAATIPTPPVATPEPQAAATSAPQASGRLLAGKYRSPEELERGYLEAQKALRDREEQIRIANAVNQHLEGLSSNFRQTREEPRPAEYIPVQFDANNQPVVAADAFNRMIEERAGKIAREQVEATLRPLSALSQANSRLRAEYPEIAASEGEFSQWLEAHPEYQQRAMSDPEVHLEAAYLKFDRDRGFAARSSNAQTTTAAQAVVNQARSNAAPAGGSGAASRRATESDGLATKLATLYKHAQETGDWGPYRKARLESALGANLLDSIDRTSWGR